MNRIILNSLRILSALAQQTSRHLALFGVENARDACESGASEKLVGAYLTLGAVPEIIDLIDDFQVKLDASIRTFRALTERTEREEAEAAS